MEIKKIYLDESKKAYLEAFICYPQKGFKRKGILIIPGGGYGEVCKDREGYPIADAFVSRGFNAFVLNYSVGMNNKYPAALIEASKAMKHIRDNSEEYGIDKEKVFATGFSAGGHLCACLGTMFARKEIKDAIKGLEYGINKPYGIIPVYPVISGVYHPHKGSFYNLLGTKEPTKEQLEYVSAELAVNEESSPAYIVCTSNDEIVPAYNSLIFTKAYLDIGKKAELHIYPDGPHGLALANEITSQGSEKFIRPDFEKWIDGAVFWANNL